MTTKISSTEARTVLGELLARAGYGGERFIFERRGKPLAALISIKDLQRLQSIESQEKRRPPETIQEVTEEYVTDQLAKSDAQRELRYPLRTALDVENVFASLAGIWQHLSDDDIRQIDQTLLEMRHQTTERLDSLMRGSDNG